MQADPEDMDYDYQQQRDDDKAADHAEMLADAGEDEVGMLAGKDRGAVLIVNSGETSGCKAHLALRGLPSDAPAIGVDARIVGSDKSLLLIVLQEVVPQQRYRRGNKCPAYREPVELHAQRIEHYEKDAEQNARASKVRGDADDHQEHDAEMRRHLHHRQERIDIPVLFKISHLLCGDDYVQDLDDLRGLYADTGEPYPALVAGAVVLPEDDERDEQQHIYRAQYLPLLAEDIRVNYRKDHEAGDTEEQRKGLDRDVL